VALAEPIRVLVCDDHELFRRGLRMVLEAEEGIEVVAEAADGAEAVARVEDLAPDVVLMDVRMPRMGGIEATREIRRRFPMTRIIVLSVSDEEDDLYGAFKAGANGYLLKEVSIEEVADAARAVASGRTLLAPAVAANLLADMGRLSQTGRPLTDREMDVLRMVALGRSEAEVASQLGVPESTVHNHLGNVLAKFQGAP
jgi:DNA-binding NarL/FixJ family response regulator